MIKQLLLCLSGLLLLLALLLFYFGVGYWLERPNEFLSNDPTNKKKALPKSSFELDPSFYEKIGGPLFKLEESVPSLQVPDLRQQLIYYGRNGRPDADQSSTPLHFSLSTNSRLVVSVKPGNPLYLFYDRKATPPHYTFSPNNVKTSLWIIPSPMGQEALIRVIMENEKGEPISQPDLFANFKLPEKEFSRTVVNNWEINGQRVDGTLLARQRARWYGVDKFLDDHGGKEFDAERGKQRVDFGENDDLYSVYITVGDVLVWDDGRWKVVKPGPDSMGKPLLLVKKIDDRLMSLEIWDNEGKAKLAINLLKTAEPWGPQNVQVLQGAFKFIGSRTRKQSVFEINRERMVLNPSDWLLLTPKGWKKLNTEEEIDDYVKRRVTGPLFVFEGIERKDEKQILTGTLYSPSRNEETPIEIPLQATAKPKVMKEKGEVKETQKSDKRAPKSGLSKEEQAEQQLNKNVTEMLEDLLNPLPKGDAKGTLLEQIRQIKQLASPNNMAK